MVTTYRYGGYCSGAYANKRTQITWVCDSSTEFEVEQVSANGIMENSCTIWMNIKSKYACPINSALDPTEEPTPSPTGSPIPASERLFNCTFTIGQKTWDLSALMIPDSDSKQYYTVAAGHYDDHSDSDTTFYFNICGDIGSIPPECDSVNTTVCTDPWMYNGEETGYCDSPHVTRPAGTLTHGVAVYDDGTCLAMAGIGCCCFL